jgi:hypothetical protein
MYHSEVSVLFLIDHAVSEITEIEYSLFLSQKAMVGLVVGGFSLHVFNK